MRDRTLAQIGHLNDCDQAFRRAQHSRSPIAVTVQKYITLVFQPIRISWCLLYRQGNIYRQLRTLGHVCSFMRERGCADNMVRLIIY